MPIIQIHSIQSFDLTSLIFPFLVYYDLNIVYFYLIPLLTITSKSFDAFIRTTSSVINFYSACHFLWSIITLQPLSFEFLPHLFLALNLKIYLNSFLPIFILISLLNSHRLIIIILAINHIIFMPVFELIFLQINIIIASIVLVIMSNLFNIFITYAYNYMLN